jgi:hypothetical protein
VNGLVDHDALVAERKGMSQEEAQIHYLCMEMIEPLSGGVILGGYVMTSEDDGRQYPVLRVKINDKIYGVTISADDEMNDGGRLFIEEEVSNG